MIANVVSSLSRSSRLSDVLTSYHFHLLEVGGNGGVSVFSLAAGFQAITAPDLQIKTKEYRQMHRPTARRFVESAQWSDVVLRRGVRLGDNDFYFWITGAMDGRIAFRRNLLLIQYSEVSLGISNTDEFSGPALPLAKFMPLTDLVQRMPARAWLMRGCVPIAYKAASDFDAVSPELSSMELTISPETVEEFSFSAGV